MGWTCAHCPGTISHPKMSWKAAYIERASKLNPFSYDATSESTIELCVVAHGCSSCRARALQHDPCVIRINLRARLEQILHMAALGREHIIWYVLLFVSKDCYGQTLIYVIDSLHHEL